MTSSLKKISLLFLILINSNFLFSQNLVPNPGFEGFEGCPENGDYFNFRHLKEWESRKFIDQKGLEVVNSPDFFHSCSRGSHDVPVNNFGTQAPKEGEAYSGIFVFSSHSREYIQVRLYDTLEKGEKYEISLFVSLADKSRQAVNSLGAYFSAGQQFHEVEDDFIMLTNPEATLLEDKKNWTRISACFEATGDELFLTLGNFAADSLIIHDWIPKNTLKDQTPKTYYYLDKVSLIKCSGESSCSCSKYGSSLEETEKILMENDSATLVMENFYFKVDDYRLMPGSHSFLNKLSHYLKDHPSITVKILGHTDNTGAEEYNVILSRKRSGEVYKYLSEKGISSGRMSFTGFGSSRPIAENSTFEGRKKNRRVEIILIEK